MGCQQLIEDYWRRLSEGHIAVCLQPQEAMMVQSQDYNMNMAMVMGQMGATVNPTIYKSTIMHQDQVNTLTLNEHQVMALIGASMALDNTIASVVEYKVPDFMQMPGGPEAVYKELQEMTKRRFNTEKPIPQHLKRTAMECRIVCTQKRDG